jgi:hypothetical protein
LRFYVLVVLAIILSRLVLWAADETPGPRNRAGLFAWLLRGFVVWGLASVLGYV